MLTCFVLEMKHLLAGAENTTAVIHVCQGNMPQAAIIWNTKVDQLTLNIKRGGHQVNLAFLIDHYNINTNNTILSHAIHHSLTFGKILKCF